MGKLDSKIAIVTGSSYGIGRGIAVAFAREGASARVRECASARVRERHREPSLGAGAT